MKDKLNRVVSPTVKNILFILLGFILPQLAVVGGILTNDHFKAIELKKELDGKASAQDLSEYIKLNKMQHDLECQINNQAHDNISDRIDGNEVYFREQLKEVNERIKRLENRIFRDSSMRGANGKGTLNSGYDLSKGVSLMWGAGVYYGDYCKPKPIKKNSMCIGIF